MAANGKGPLADIVSRPRLGASDMAAAASPAVHALGLDAEASRLSVRALRKRRPTSTLHSLTTESAGMTEGYVQTWLETEMALYNVVKAHAWEPEVAARLEHLRRRVGAIAEKVIAELGMEAVVQETMSENNAPRSIALGMIMATNRPVADEIARLIVLIEETERRPGTGQHPKHPLEPAWLDERSRSARDRLLALALPKLPEPNRHLLKLPTNEL